MLLHHITANFSPRTKHFVTRWDSFDLKQFKIWL